MFDCSWRKIQILKDYCTSYCNTEYYIDLSISYEVETIYYLKYCSVEHDFMAKILYSN